MWRAVTHPEARVLLLFIGTLGGVLTLSGCGGSGGSAEGGTGSLTLAVTDGPVEEADHVFVQFSSITLKPADSEPFTLALIEPRRIDLLAQRNGRSELLLHDERVAAGDYEWLRLGVDLGPGETTIVVDGAEHDLHIPSGARTGLKLVSRFRVPSQGVLALTIDFGLRKSIVRSGPPPGAAVTAAPPLPVYRLRPALRLVANDAVGHVAVAATENYVSTRCGADDADRAVYLFAGSGIEPDDVDMSTDNDVDPMTSVSLEQQADSGDYTGIAGFLEPGTYTAAFTCDPEADLADRDDLLVFHDAADVEVTTGATARYDLPPTPAP